MYTGTSQILMMWMFDEGCWRILMQWHSVLFVPEQILGRLF